MRIPSDNFGLLLELFHEQCMAADIYGDEFRDALLVFCARELAARRQEEVLNLLEYSQQNRTAILELIQEMPGATL